MANSTILYIYICIIYQSSRLTTPQCLPTPHDRGQCCAEQVIYWNYIILYYYVLYSFEFATFFVRLVAGAYTVSPYIIIYSYDKYLRSIICTLHGISTLEKNRVGLGTRTGSSFMAYVAIYRVSIVLSKLIYPLT